MKRHTWYYQIHLGTFLIRPVGPKFQPWFEDEFLGGNYDTPQQALDDLAGGHTDWPAIGDPSQLGLPDDIGDWDIG